MNEFGMSDAQEIKMQDAENYKKIKPEKGMTIERARHLVENLFSQMQEMDVEKKDASEYDENGRRELTNDEKQMLQEKLEWSDKRMEKCSIYEDGTVYLRTDKCDMEGMVSERGIPYERNTININGVKIEGVFPKFNSVFDTELLPENYKTRSYDNICNKNLYDAIQKNPDLEKKFTVDQLKDIANERTPRGYAWHHHEEPGKMQLVKREDHDRTIGGAPHTGGNSLWGADSIAKSGKGEEF